VQSTYGYHIIKAGSRQAASQMPFEQVKAQLIQQMETDQKDQVFNTYLDQLKNAADIKDLRQK
jgi:parvulin-like peptidyl-prolyl isomerase